MLNVVPTVYIPTMGRYDNLRKIVPAWLAQGLDVRLVVDQSEFREHVRLRDSLRWQKRVHVVPVSKSYPRGIGAARRFCVNHARRAFLTAIIMADDDMRPDTDVAPLLAEAAQDDVLGIGAVRSIHDRFTGGAITRLRKEGAGPILCPGGWGFQLFGLNLKNAVAFGNFDDRLHTAGEDAELARNGIVNGYPWMVHCEVVCSAIGARYAAGGINTRFSAPERRSEAELECLALIHERWPEYTNEPGKRLRMAWQKMLDDNIAEWRSLSALHGGQL